MTKSSLINTAALLIISGLIIAIMILAKAVLLPLFISIFLALILLPVCRKLEKMGLPRILAVLIAEFTLVAFFAGIFSLFILQMLQFSSDVPLISNKIMIWYNDFASNITADNLIDKQGLDNYVEENFMSIFKTTGGILSSILGGITSAITFLVLVPIYTFMLLSYRKNFAAFLRAERMQDNTKASVLSSKIIEMVGKYLSGLFVVILAMSVVNSTVLYFIGLKYYIFFGCFAAVLILIPYIGAIVGSILPILYCLATEDDMTMVLMVAGYFLAAQMVEGNLITPKVVGSKVNVNPLTVIVAVIVGSLIWGLIGMILAVPMVAILRIVLYNNPELKSYSYLLADKIDEDDKPI
jgi:predicted PurR-regulated permease PerM